MFWLLKRNGEVYVTIVLNCSKEELLPIIQGKIIAGSIIRTYGWKAYDGLILNGYTHYRVYHHENEFSRGKPHVNGIESFWSFAKRRLAKFNGLTDEKFILHLKECEVRLNHRKDDFPALMESIFQYSKKIIVKTLKYIKNVAPFLVENYYSVLINQKNEKGKKYTIIFKFNNNDNTITPQFIVPFPDNCEEKHPCDKISIKKLR